jgi:hypothetical protein
MLGARLSCVEAAQVRADGWIRYRCLRQRALALRLGQVKAGLQKVKCALQGRLVHGSIV